MNLVNQIVTHKIFGNGKIVTVIEGKMTVSFKDGEKYFPFPDAFRSFLEIQDVNLSEQIKQLLQSDDEKKRLEQEEKEKNRINEKQKLTPKPKRANNINVRSERPNIAFKCNYCDGGKSNTQVGFHGVCSDPVIYNNIVVEKRTWCNADECPCLQYYNKEMSRKELDSICKKGGFVCYEGKMLKEWEAMAGVYHNGENKGKPMKLKRVQSNSLCVLTTRDPQSKENERYIFAVFLIDESYEGDDFDEGYVSTKSKYKIKLSPKEAHSLLFWTYHANDNRSESVVWSSGLHRYFDDIQGALILRDIVKVKTGTSDERLAVDFFEHFCKINGIDSLQLGEPQGALNLKLEQLSSTT